jgi:hypothetical protein
MRINILDSKGSEMAQKRLYSTESHCSVEGCTECVYAKWLCRKHYERQRTGRDLQLETYINKGRVCAVEGCERGAKALGLCASHYSRFARNGDPLAPPRTAPLDQDFLSDGAPIGTPCRERRCYGKIAARGMCWRHYRRWLAYRKQEDIR